VAWHQIPYRVFPCPPDVSFPAGHSAKRPVLRLDLLNGSARLPCYAIVDSGADHCTFPLSFALQLGLDPLTKPASSILGVGNGSVPTFYWPIKIEFPGVTTLDVYAGFTLGLDSVGLGLLGQCGFFDHVNVAFNHRSGLFAVEIDDPPSTVPSV
jgi:hypothetical protein